MQWCILKVDQNGTELACITAAGALLGPGGPEAPCITFNHTFYMLIEYENSLLFEAKIGQPPPSTNQNAVFVQADSVFNNSSEYIPEAVKSIAARQR
jgi:hypothetical protein